MTDSEILQKLIDNDPEFQQLVFEANANTNSLFDRTGEELAATKNFTKFNKYSLEEFYATYKVILG